MGLWKLISLKFKETILQIGVFLQGWISCIIRWQISQNDYHFFLFRKSCSSSHDQLYKGWLLLCLVNHMTKCTQNTNQITVFWAIVFLLNPSAQVVNDFLFWLPNSYNFFTIYSSLLVYAFLWELINVLKKEICSQQLVVKKKVYSNW